MSNEVTVREAIRITGYSRQQIYNIIVNGRVPARREGHEYRIDRRALLAYQKSPRGTQQA
jgi:excisionase family DNA binding protein